MCLKKISIIISASVIWTADYHNIVSGCLRSVEENAAGQDIEIIIVDNVMYGEKARNLLLACQTSGCRILPYPYKFHRSKVANFAAGHALGKYLLFLDNDTCLQKGCLGKMIETMESDESIRAVGARIIDFNRRNKFTSGYLMADGKLTLSDERGRQGGEVEDRDGLQLCCMMVDRTAFEEAGGFAENFWFFNADVDLCLKFKALGYRCVINNEAHVHHLGGLTRSIFRENHFPREYDDLLLKRKWSPVDVDCERTSKELLVVKLLTLGDAVLVTPTLKALRKKYVDHRITLLTCKGWKDVFEGSPYIDELIAVDHPESTFKPGYLFYDRLTFDWLGAKNWDMVIQLNCLDFCGEYRRTGLHFRDFYAEIAGVYPLADKRYFIPVTAEHRDTVDRILKEHETGEKIICIHTNGGWKLKNWSENRWKEFAGEIHKRYGSNVILIGGKGEAIYSPHVINLAGILNIKELVALFERADLFVGLDSGPMHIASAANAPIVAMFSVTHSKVGAPNSDRYITIQAPLSCEIPCGLKNCKHGINCTDSITVETVLRAAAKLLEAQGPVQEDWKGDEPASISFEDWEWRTRDPAIPVGDDVMTELRKEQYQRQENKRPRQDAIRVFFQTRGNVFDQPGGDTEVLLNLEKHLRKSGCRVDFSSSPADSLEDADIVHILNFENEFAVNAALQSKPYVVTPMYEDFDRYMIKSQKVVNLFKDNLDGSVDDSELEKFIGNLGEKYIFQREFNFISSNAQSIIVSGTSEGRRIRRDFPEASQIDVVQLGFNRPGNPVDVSSQLFSSKYEVKDFVLCVGRLETRKNQMMLLHALKNDDIPLVFVDSKTVQPEYEEMCKRFRRKGRTIFTGRISRDMLFSAYKGAKVHALASWYELPGLVSLEAAWWGCNIVTSDWGTIKEYLGSKAYYCEPDNPESIRRAVLSALTDPKTGEARRATEQYTWDNEIKKILGIYNRVLAFCDTEEGARRLRCIAESGNREAMFHRMRKKAHLSMTINPKEAVKIASDLLTFKSDDSFSLYVRGVGHLVSMNYAKAEQDLKRAIRLGHCINPKAYLYLYLALTKQNKYAESINTLRKGFNNLPFLPDMTSNLMREYLEESSHALSLPSASQW